MRAARSAQMKSLFLRKVPDDVYDQVHSAAGARQMSSTEYVSAVVRLHRELRKILDGPEDPAQRIGAIQKSVTQLGLTTVER